jgi:hypothetical protein
MYSYESLINCFLFFLLFCTISSGADHGKPSLMHEYFKSSAISYQEDEVEKTCVDLTEFLMFLEKYYKSDPLSCLEEVYSIRDPSFDKIFFVNRIRYHSEDFVDLPLIHRPNLSGAIEICHGIKMTVLRHLFKPFKSKHDLEMTSSIINQLTKFLERYIRLVFLPKNRTADVNMYLRHIKAWRFVIRTFSSYLPNGSIDYHQLFPILSYLTKSEGIKDQKYDENNYKYYLLLAT